MTRACWRCKRPAAEPGLFCPADGARLVEKDAWSGKVVAGRYRLEGLIGAGGFGRVYVGVLRVALEEFGLEPGEPVAVKLLLRQGRSADDWEAVKKAQAREASVARRLAGEHLIPLFHTGEDEETESVYAVMPLGGRDLRTVLDDEGPGSRDYRPEFWLPRAAAVGVEIGGALAALHGEGIFHRDVKPHNVLEAQGRMVLIDYNISKELHDSAQSLSGIKGTAAYIAPDYWTPGLDPKAKDFWRGVDQYSFGVMMYELFRGELPFTAPAGPHQHNVLIEKHRTAAPRPIREARPEVPEAIDAAVLRMLEKVPSRRYPDLRAALEAFHPYARAVQDFAPKTGGRPVPDAPSGSDIEVTDLEVETDPATGRRRYVLRF